jgi:hypothetical protein
LVSTHPENGIQNFVAAGKSRAKVQAAGAGVE